MPPKLIIAPNEAVFARDGKLVGRGRFFPPLLVAPSEGKLFVIPPDAGLVKLVRELPPLSPSIRSELVAGGRLFNLALGWRKAGEDEYTTVKTVPHTDWQPPVNLSPSFGEWLDAQDYPILVLDNGGFIQRSNPAGISRFPILAKASKEPLFWSLLDEPEALRLQELWSQGDEEEGQGDFRRLLQLRNNTGTVHAAVVFAPHPDDEASQLMAAGQRLALTHAGEGLLLLDKYGFLLYASSNCQAIMGMEEASLVGKRLLSLVKDARQNMLLGRMLGGERIAMPLIVETKPGNGKPVQVRLETAELSPELEERVALALRIKPAQELLRQQDREARLSLLDELLGFGGGPLLASFSTADDVLLYISPNCAAWTGITPDQFQLNPRRFWALFPPYLFTASSEPSPNHQIQISHTILQRNDGSVVPVKVQMASDAQRHRKDVFIQTLDSLALGEDYAQILKALADLNANPNLHDQLRLLLENLLAITGCGRVVINIFDAITGNVISSVAVPDSDDESHRESIPPDIVPQAYETTLLAQRVIQSSADGTIIKRLIITNRSEECGELFLFSPDAGRLDEIDLAPWLNLLGLSIVLWRLQNAFAREDELNRILGYGLENIIVHAMQKLARDLVDLTCAGGNSLGKLNEITHELEQTLTSIRELQLFATLDKAPPESELLDLEQLLGGLGTEFIARLSQVGGLLTVERGLPQIIAPREYLRLVFSRLIEFAITHHGSPQSLRMNISAYLLESATRIVFTITPSQLKMEECQVLFNPYYSAGDAETQDIGLALVKKIVETIGGNIIVYNDGSGSAMFSIFLPHRHR